MERLLKKGLLLSGAFLFCLPMLLTVLYSFTVQTLETDLFRLNLLPGRFSLHGYYELLAEHSGILRNFWNSVFYALVITVFNILVAVPAAYAFSQAKFKGKDTIFFFYIVLMMMPLQVTLLPNYIGLRDLKLLDTPYSIILPAIFTPISVFLLTQYMNGLDNDCIEAALLETKSVGTLIKKVVLPQLRPCILAVFVFVFVEHWNMIEQPNIYLKKDIWKPLTSFLTMNGGLSISGILAGSVLFMIPIAILYLYFHDSLERGLECMKL